MLVLTHLVRGLSAAELVAIVAYMLLMMGVTLTACMVPTRRALRIDPTAALKAEA